MVCVYDVDVCVMYIHAACVCFICTHGLNDTPASPTDEALIVWMRTAALPTFRCAGMRRISFVSCDTLHPRRKLYARIDGVLPKGTYVDGLCFML